MDPAGDRSFGAEVLSGFVPDSSVARTLLDESVRMIDDSGEVALRVQDVVTAAGVQIPILYRHFGNREGLVKAAHVQRMITEIGDQVSGLADAVLAATTADEFRSIVEGMIERAISDEEREGRAKQISVLGACYGRPDLAHAISRLEHSSTMEMAEALSPAQARGWIEADLELRVFAEWFGSQLLARFAIEIDRQDTDTSGWDEIFRRSVMAALFGSA